MSDKCFVCDKNIDKTGGDVTKVSEKGILSLIKASRDRGDNKSQHIVGLKSLLIHTSCRKRYTRIGTIVADMKRASTSSSEPTESVRMRSSLPKFNFKENCFLCSEPVKQSTKTPVGNRRVVYSVRTLTIKHTCLEAGLARDDDWGKAVVGRLASISDLVAEEAVYHNDCYLKFVKKLYKQPTSSTPSESHVSKAMEEICAFLEDSIDTQFSQDEIMNAVTGTKPQWRTIKTELQKRYGDRVILTQGCNRFNVPVICFRDTGYKLLNDAWYENKDTNKSAERIRIVLKAAEIIRQDIQSEMFKSDTYPPSDNFLDEAENIPPSLLAFLNGVMMKKTKREDQTKRKCIAIGHAITAVVRPRTFFSPVLGSLSLLLYRNYASKNLVYLLSSLGFCASYYEAQKLEMSAIAHARPTFKKGSFNQFVFDNADFNVCTSDGLNTFHAMGGIRCITPSSTAERGSEIPRLTKMPTAHDIGKLGVVQLETFQGKQVSLKNVTVKDIEIPDQRAHPEPHDILWYAATKQHIPVPGWKGYMQCVTAGNFSEKTTVVTLPFINAPPSDYSAVFTALLYASEMCENINQKSLIVTFDQPLYWKAREIVAAAPPDSQLGKCVVRLGGFHLLMSFLGCIGYLMSGSGLKELLSTVYASLSVDKMLQGHAFARAVRGHSIVTTALSHVILDHIQLTEEEQSCVEEFMASFLQEPPSLTTLNNNPTLKSLAIKFGEALDELSENGPTARLWVQYFKMVYLMKEYIHAERSGNWDAHLNCVKRMIPFFHASGHFPYAKSCHLYVQDMENLPSKMTPEDYTKFVTSGYFTVRRSDRFWSGVWSDMTIETTLMRAFHSRGGVTRGRGVADSALSKWVIGMSATHDICVSLEEFCGVLFSSSEQHKDFGEAHRTKDAADIAKLTEWFNTNHPFPEIGDIMSIATGVVGDETVTCYDAVKVGKEAMSKMVNLPFSDIKLSRKDRALPLSSVSSSIRIQDEKVPVNPLLLFQRISIAKKTDEDLKTYMKYELAPFPLALFSENRIMRKSKKSVIYTLFHPTDKDVRLSNYDIVIDGGFLIHKVIWQRGSSITAICDGYLRFVRTHYPGRSVTIVFDGYTNPHSTKAAEQERRYRLKRSANINFNWETEINTKQEDFLSNVYNKSLLIDMLRSKLQENGINTLQSKDDADVLIVDTAIEISDTSSVAVIGEDVDLILLLIDKTPDGRDIVFQKPGRGKTETRIFSIQDLQQLKLDDLLFLHAFTGCDTTSSPFRKSKLFFFKLYEKSPEVQNAAKVFSSPSSSQAEVEEAGKTCFLKWYGAPPGEKSLNLHRYHSFVKSVVSIKPDISTLPPTEGAAKQHSLRTYHQVQLWLGNELPPDMWGWKCTEKNVLTPVQTEDAVAPEELLKLVFCRCTRDCTSGKCSCRKSQLKCSSVCHNCQGNCFNGSQVVDDEEEEPLPIDEDDTEPAEEKLSVNILPAEEQLPGPSHPKRARKSVI